MTDDFQALKDLETVKAEIKAKDVAGDKHSKTLYFPYSPEEYSSDAEYLRKLNGDLEQKVRSGEGFINYFNPAIKADKVIYCQVKRARE